MYCVVLRSAALLFLCFIASASLVFARGSDPRRSPAEWTKGYTLVLVDAQSKNDLIEAREFIAAAGGTIAVVLPPRAIFGWITPEVEARIVGKHHVVSVHRSMVNAQAVPFHDSDTRLAINLFNDIASGRTARRIEREAVRKPGPENERPGNIECSLPHPAMDREQVIRNMRLLGADPAGAVRPQFFGNSDAMDSTVTVALFFVESNGAGDPNTYSWSSADVASSIAAALEGLTWWVDQSAAFHLGRPLQFSLVPYTPDNPACQVPWEPVLHPGSDANLWVNQIMSNLGATAGDVFSRIGAFDQSVRQQYHTDWAYSIFLAYNPEPAPNSFTDRRASWAYIGGPYIQSLFHSFGWDLRRIISHETGHIFYACDEYFQPGYQVCSCTCAPEIRPAATNGNCQDASCNINSTPCMMRLNELALCPFTAAQIGWIQSQPPPPPSAPTGLVATASSPNQVSLLWQDTSDKEDGFQIERRGGTSADFSQIIVMQANATSYIDGTALANTAYAYRIRAFNISGQSAYSNEASVITPVTASSLAVGTTSMPDATVGVPYDRTLLPSGGKPDYVWIVDSGTLPAGLTLAQAGANAGKISGNPTTAGTSNFVVRVTDSDNSVATRALTIVVRPAAPLTITSTQLPRGSVGNAYSQNLGATGGQTPYNWAKDSGNLPDGLTLNQTTGVISGVPERAGSSSFVIRLSDQAQATTTATLSIVINPSIAALSIDTQSLPDGVIGQAYSRALLASGGTTPYAWSITSGRLPDGLQLSADGTISGQPSTTGTSTFEVHVTEQSGQTASKTLTIDIETAPDLTILTQNPMPLAAIGVPYRQELKATAGTAPYTWVKKKKAKFGSLPDGLALSSDGVLSGTPTVQGTSDFTVIVSDAVGRQAKKPLTIEVGPPPPPLAIRTDSLPFATQGLPYNGRLDAAGGLLPYIWSLDSGLLPDGLTLHDDGTITGRPTTIGTGAFTVRVKDSSGTSSTRAMFIIVGPPPPPLTIQTVQLPDTTAERSYSQTLLASGGLPPYSWSLASGSLGQGLNLSADGVISGTPNSPGTVVFVVRCTDSAQQTVTRTLAISIKPADRLAPFGNLETPDFRATLNNTATGSGWALDNVGVATIEVLVDGTKATEAIYGLPRPDIGAVWGSFPNAAHAGFNFSFDTTKFSNGDHILSVRLLDAAGNAIVVGTRPITLQNNVFMITTANLPRGRKGEAYSQQLTAVNGRPPYTWVIASGSLPAGLSLTASGQIVGTPTVFGSNFAFGVRATDSAAGVAVASFTLTIVPDVDPLRVVTAGDLPGGLTGIDYSTQLFFTGGRPPVSWAMNSGTLPPGLSLNSNTGIISGRPTTVGNYTFFVRVIDSETTTAISQAINLNIQLGPLGVIDTGTLTGGATGANYSYQLRGTGGTGPYTWALNNGVLPPGLAVNPTTGAIAGKPTVPGSYAFVIKITDSTLASALSDTLRIIVAAGPLSVLTTGDLTGAQVNVDYTFTLQGNGGTLPYTWSIFSGTLPTGLTLNGATGVISGKPTAAAPFTFVVQVKDAANVTATSGPLRIVVSP